MAHFLNTATLKALTLATVVVVQSTSTAQAQPTFDASLFFPAAPGEYSTLLVSGLSYETRAVLPGSVVVNGQTTSVVGVSGGESDGARAYVSDDESGVRTHRLFLPNLLIEGVGFVDRTTTYSPPIVNAASSFSVGERFDTAGTAFFEFSDGYSETLSFTHAVLVRGPDRVSVPFGTFDALRFDESNTICGAGSFSVTSTTQTWRVAGLGIVRQEFSDGVSIVVSELTATNRNYAPEPAGASLGWAALVALCALSASRARRSVG